MTDSRDGTMEMLMIPCRIFDCNKKSECKVPVETPKSKK